jgi:hypothetical protein
LQTHIAQTVAIACHANAALRRLVGPGTLEGNSTFQFCEWVKLASPGRRGLLRAFAHPEPLDPTVWIEHHCRERTVRVLLDAVDGWRLGAVLGETAWVFGGMGSWNDAIYEGEAGREYGRVTGAWEAALCDALIAATHASAP